VTTVWTGFDQPESLGRREFGGTVALPIWMNYMGAALKDKPLHTSRSRKASSACGRPGQRPRGLAEHAERLLRTVQGRRHAAVGQRAGQWRAPGSPLPADEAAPIDLF
jgi:penicillin-binding protein 1A